MKDLYERLGRKLKEAREACGLSQAQVAECLGIKREQVSYFETGSREISLAMLEEIAALYGYDVDFFLEADNEESEPVTLAFRTNGLDEHDLQAIAQARKFVMNLHWLNKLLAKERVLE